MPQVGYVRTFVRIVKGYFDNHDTKSSNAKNDLSYASFFERREILFERISLVEFSRRKLLITVPEEFLISTRVSSLLQPREEKVHDTRTATAANRPEIRR